MTGVSFTWQIQNAPVEREPSYTCSVGGIVCRVSPTAGLLGEDAKDWILVIAGKRHGEFDTHQEAMQAAPDALEKVANLALAETHALRKGDGPPMLHCNRAGLYEEET